MAEFLLELLSEDIPARMQARAAEDLKRIFTERLSKAGLAFGRAEAHSTPRRLALVVDGLPERQPDLREERRGPRVGAPEQAVQGFLRANGLDSLEQCEQRDTGKGVFWFAVVEKNGAATTDLLPDIISETVREFPWPKSMRWAMSTMRWVRPLSGILTVFNGRRIGGELVTGKAWGVSSEGPVLVDDLMPFGMYTYGHRFLAPQPLMISSFADYEEQLLNAFVILDREKRKAVIRAETERLAESEGLTVAPDEGLLDEVAGLVEWPVALMGSIDEPFMELPPEVRQTSMRVNQRYFTLVNPDGSPAPRFILIANMITEDEGAAIVSGNERVLRARLSDAKFFWDQDLKTELEGRVPKLRQITFHGQLGTIADKVDRVHRLAAELAESIPGCDAEKAGRAARLAKADLVSGMVGEFPELQGVMGRYYALAQGEDPAVAEAIAEHYKPLGPNDRCPTAPISIAVALADKIDTLVGFFAVDEKPTGSKDPFALRRAALGVIRLVVENGLRLALRPLLLRAYDTMPVHQQTAILEGSPESVGTREASYADRTIVTPGGDAVLADLPSGDVVAADLLAFFADRLKVALREKGVRHDLVDAVFALGSEDDLLRLLARVDALQAFLATENGANLLVAYRRAANIVRIEEKKDAASYNGAPEQAALAADEEKALWSALRRAEGEIDSALAKEDFSGAMQAMAALRTPVDSFFDKVTVNTDQPELRANRLRLLAQIKATMDRVAEFSRIEG